MVITTSYVNANGCSGSILGGHLISPVQEAECLLGPPS